MDAYDKKDTKGQNHGRLVRLYGIFDRAKLLPFLKRSDHYPIQEALDICQREKYYPEMVYLLGRIGDTKEALELIITKLKDMQQAISFCQEQNDPDLWNDLINHSLNKPGKKKLKKKFYQAHAVIFLFCRVHYLFVTKHRHICRSYGLSSEN